MYSSAGILVVRGDSPYRTIADLKGRRVLLGAAGSGLVVLRRYVLEGLGLDVHRNSDVGILGKRQSRPADGVKRRSRCAVGAVTWGGPDSRPSHAVQRGHASSVPKPMTSPASGPSIRFSNLSPSPRRHILGRIVPSTPLAHRGSILAQPDLPEDLAYRFARALQRGQPALGQRLTAAQETTAANTATGSYRSDLLHPGVVRYLQEMG